MFAARSSPIFHSHDMDFGLSSRSLPVRKLEFSKFDGVGAESDQHVNICSFAVRCDRRWPSTQ